MFLLENAGLLPANTWQNLWRLWPVVLVLVGLELLIGQRVPWLTLFGLALVVIALGVAASSFGTFRGPEPVAIRGRTIETDLGAARQAAVTVRFGAGELKVGPMRSPDAGKLASLTYEGPELERLEPNYAVQGETGRLEYRLDAWRGQTFDPFTNRGNVRMDVGLNPAVPITSLNVQGGAADAELDLRDLVVNNLDVSIGAAATEIQLPQTGTTNVHVSGGAATITINVPENVAARISHKGGLTALEVNENRFPSAGNNRYQSPDYDSAQNKVDITLETGVTAVEIN